MCQCKPPNLSLDLNLILMNSADSLNGTLLNFCQEEKTEVLL